MEVSYGVQHPWLAKVLEAIGSYVTGEGLKFVDRVGEAVAILYPATYPLETSKGLGIGRVSVVMGPRGCGKTELAKAIRFAIEVSKIDEVEIVLLEYRCGEGFAETLMHTVGRSVKELIVEALRKLVPEALSRIVEIATGFRIPSLVDGLSLLLTMSRSARRDAMYIVIEDEVRGSLESVKQMLEVDANEVKELLRYGIRAKLIYFTSDATMASLQPSIGTKVDWYLVWNLPREAFEELVRQWRSYAVKGLDVDTLWRLVGGNPRELIDLAKDWDPKRYINDKLSIVMDSLRSYALATGVGMDQLVEEIEELVEDLDRAGWLRLWQYLVRNNVGIDIDTRFVRLTPLPREPWIGRYHSFQLPIYYWILKTMAERKSLDIVPSNVLETISSTKNES